MLLIPGHIIGIFLILVIPKRIQMYYLESWQNFVLLPTGFLVKGSQPEGFF